MFAFRIGLSRWSLVFVPVLALSRGHVAAESPLPASSELFVSV